MKDADDSDAIAGWQIENQDFGKAFNPPLARSSQMRG